MANDSGALGGFSGGITEGIRAAAMAEHVKQQRQQIEMAKQEQKTKQASWFFGELRNAMAMPADVRKKRIDSLGKMAQQLMIPVDPTSLDLLKSPAMESQVSNALAALSGQPAAEVQGLGVIADSKQMLAALQGIGTAAGKAQQDQTKVAGQRIESIGKLKTQIRQAHEADMEIVRRANDLFALASDPKRRKEAFPADTARVLFSKISDPEGVVRGSEVARLTGLSGGLLKRMVLALDKALAGQELDETQWRQVVSVADLLSDQAESKLNRTIELSIRPQAQSLGVPEEQITASVPRKAAFDFQREFGIPQPSANPLAKLSPEKRKKFDAIIANLSKRGVVEREAALNAIDPRLRPYIQQAVNERANIAKE